MDLVADRALHNPFASMEASVINANIEDAATQAEWDAYNAEERRAAARRRFVRNCGF